MQAATTLWLFIKVLLLLVAVSGEAEDCRRGFYRDTGIYATECTVGMRMPALCDHPYLLFPHSLALEAATAK
jgi:hypothetical protein